MEKRKIGKYTITISDSPMIAEIRCGKTHMAMRIHITDKLILESTDKEKDVERVLKMERISLNRRLAQIEKLLNNETK